MNDKKATWIALTGYRVLQNNNLLHVRNLSRAAKMDKQLGQSYSVYHAQKDFDLIQQIAPSQKISSTYESKYWTDQARRFKESGLDKMGVVGLLIEDISEIYYENSNFNQRLHENINQNKFEIEQRASLYQDLSTIYDRTVESTSFETVVNDMYANILGSATTKSMEEMLRENPDFANQETIKSDLNYIKNEHTDIKKIATRIIEKVASNDEAINDVRSKLDEFTRLPDYSNRILIELAEQQDLQRLQRLEKFNDDSLRSSVFLLTTLIGDKNSTRKLIALVDSSIEIKNAYKFYVQGVSDAKGNNFALALGSAALMGNFLSIGIGLTSVFQSKNEVSLEGIILEGLQKISEQIADLGKYITDRFNFTDDLLKDLNTEIVTGFNQMKISIENIKYQVVAVNNSIRNLSNQNENYQIQIIDTLDRIELKDFTDSIILLKSFITDVERNMTQDEYLDYVRAFRKHFEYSKKDHYSSSDKVINNIQDLVNLAGELTNSKMINAYRSFLVKFYGISLTGDRLNPLMFETLLDGCLTLIANAKNNFIGNPKALFSELIFEGKLYEYESDLLKNAYAKQYTKLLDDLFLNYVKASKALRINAAETRRSIIFNEIGNKTDILDLLDLYHRILNNNDIYSNKIVSDFIEYITETEISHNETTQESIHPAGIEKPLNQIPWMGDKYSPRVKLRKDIIIDALERFPSLPILFAINSKNLHIRYTRFLNGAFVVFPLKSGAIVLNELPAGFATPGIYIEYCLEDGATKKGLLQQELTIKGVPRVVAATDLGGEYISFNRQIIEVNLDRFFDECIQFGSILTRDEVVGATTNLEQINDALFTLLAKIQIDYINVITNTSSDLYKNAKELESLGKIIKYYIEMAYPKEVCFDAELRSIICEKNLNSHQVQFFDTKCFTDIVSSTFYTKDNYIESYEIFSELFLDNIEDDTTYFVENLSNKLLELIKFNKYANFETINQRKVNYIDTILKVSEPDA